MINKFQKGGKQQDAVMQFVKGLADTLQADPNEVIQLAQNNPDALESAVQVYQQTKGDMKKAAQAFTQTIQKKTKKALHGAKLQYFKDLKNQCADDEELYYYKKGGSLGCGCKKKMEEGGQTPKKSPVDKFRNAWTKKDEQKLDSLSSQKRLTPQGQKEKEKLQNKFKKAPNRKDYEIDEGEKGMKLSKEGKVCPKCGKVHTAGMGCVVAKFKAAKCGAKVNKHEQGGSLKRIPFYQAGTPEGGIEKTSSIPNRPKFILPMKVKPVNWQGSVSARSGIFDTEKDGTPVYYESFGKRSKLGDRFNRHIQTYYFPEGIKSDTTYQYFPKYGQSKVAFSKIKGDSTDYKQLKEQFNKIVSKPLDIHYFDL